MKIIKEAKENLPVDFITSFVSKSWDEVGNIKASIDGIKSAFKNTKKIEEILQGLSDAYLIAIGQLEAQLDGKIDMPDIEEDNKLTESFADDDELLLARSIQNQISNDSSNKSLENELETDKYTDTDSDNDTFKDDYIVDFEDPEPDLEIDSEITEWVNRNRNHGRHLENKLI